MDYLGLQIKLSPDATLVTKRNSRALPRKCVALLPLLALPLISMAQESSRPTPTPAIALSDKAVIRLARDAYYSLVNRGLAKFQVTVAPDWKKYVAEVTAAQSGPTPDAQKVAQMEEIQFLAAVNEEGEIRVKPFRSGGGDIDPSLAQVTDGMKQMIQGFYTTWLPLVFSNPFPDPDVSYTLKRESEKYHVLTKDGETSSDIVLDKNYLATEMAVDMPKMKVKIVPSYEKTDKGLLLTGIDSDINSGQIKVYVSIDYKEVQGFKLPSHVSYKVPFANKPGQTITVEAWFLHYQLN